MTEPIDFTEELIELRRAAEELAAALDGVAVTLKLDRDIADTARALAESGARFNDFGTRLTRYFRAASGQFGDVAHLVTGGGEWVTTVSESHAHTEEWCGHELYLLDSHDGVKLCRYCGEYHARSPWCAERCDVARREVSDADNVIVIPVAEVRVGTRVLVHPRLERGRLRDRQHGVGRVVGIYRNEGYGVAEYRVELEPPYVGVAETRLADLEVLPDVPVRGR